MKKILLAVSLFVVACGGGSKKPVQEPAPAPVAANPWDGKSPVDMCVDFAVGVCSAVVRCGGDGSECASVLGGLCSEVQGVSDPETLYKQCIPAIEAWVCDAEPPQVCQGLFN